MGVVKLNDPFFGLGMLRSNIGWTRDNIICRSKIEGKIMSHQVVLGRPGVYRILLEQRPEGTYVNVFENENSPGPYKDWLQGDLEMAMRVCEQDFGDKRDQWKEVPDEVWH